MNPVIYGRKSRFTGKGESIVNQIELTKKYISNNFENVENITIYEDEGFSGANTDRPGFNKMMDNIRKGKHDVVVCYKLDRISRNIADFSKLITELDELNVQFVSIKEQFDTSNPMGRAMMYITSIFSQLERETTAERIRDNFDELMRSGRWLSGGVPTGFTKKRIEYVTQTGKKSSCAKLEILKSEMEHVLFIYDNFRILKNINKVKNLTIEKRIKTRNDKYYSNSLIHDILRNPVYCVVDEASYNYFRLHESDMCFNLEEIDKGRGFVVYNRVNNSMKNKPISNVKDWIVAIGKHEGVVSGSHWVEIQHILDNIDVKYERTVQKPIGILNQLLICPVCSAKMGANRKVKGDRFYYICNNKKRFGSSVCDSKNINGQEIDNLVNQYMLAYTKPNHEIIKMLDKMKKKIISNGEHNEIKVLQKEIDSKKKDIDKLINSLLNFELTKSFISHVNKKVDNLDTEIKELNKTLYLKKSEIDNESLQKKFDILKKDLYRYKKDNTKLTVIEKREILKSIVKKVEYNNNTNEVHIFLK